MWLPRVEVIRSEEQNSWVARFDGMSIPRPPSLTGKANSERSRALGGGLPVKAGRRVDHMASSSGLSSGPIPGMVRLKYVHLAIIPCVRAEKAA